MNKKLATFVVALLTSAIALTGCGGGGMSTPTSPTASGPTVTTTPPTPAGVLVGQIVFSMGNTTTGGVAKTIPASRAGELRVKVSITEMGEVPLRILRMADRNATIPLGEYRFSSANGVGEVSIPYDGAETYLVLQNLGSQVISGGAEIYLF